MGHGSHMGGMSEATWDMVHTESLETGNQDNPGYVEAEKLVYTEWGTCEPHHPKKLISIIEPG